MSSDSPIDDPVLANRSSYHKHQNNPFHVSKIGAAFLVDSYFSQNKNVFSGGAIFVSSTNINLNITGCKFTHNQATIGGAISMVSTESTCILEKSSFTNNFALKGMHIFVQIKTFTSKNSQFILDDNFIESHPKLDVMAIDIEGISTFTQCGFYMKIGIIVVSKATFDTCCFFHSVDGDSTFFPPNLKSDDVKITGVTCVNFIKAADPTVDKGAIDVSGRPNSTECHKCQLITPHPTQTLTLLAKWDSQEAILSITAVCCFVVFSIFGIVCVSVEFCKTAEYEFDTESDVLTTKVPHQDEEDVGNPLLIDEMLPEGPEEDTLHQPPGPAPLLRSRKAAEIEKGNPERKVSFGLPHRSSGNPERASTDITQIDGSLLV